MTFTGAGERRWPPPLLLLLLLPAWTSAVGVGWNWRRPEPGPPAARPAVPTGLDMPLLQALVTDLGENEAISPFVMSSLMTQLYLGADGTTRDEMTPVLGLTDPTTGVAMDYLSGYRSAIDALSRNSTNVTVAIYNGMFVHRSFHVLSSYSDTLREVYGSEARPIISPEQTAAQINAAVADVTRGKIAELVDAEQLQDTVLVLVSALYFKALWKHPFVRDEELTPFYTAAGERPLRMMSLPETTSLLYANRTVFEAVALPYSEQDFCLLLLRPAEPTVASVRTLLDSLHTIDLAELVSSMFRLDMRLTMPKFKVEAEYGLSQTLPALGISEIFSPAADFSRLSRESGVLVSEVIHKVFLEVTEEGTEAAGAGAVFFTRSMPMQFVLDRPFVAVVYDRRQGLNLFTAFVGSPAADTADSAEDADTSAEYRPPKLIGLQLPRLPNVKIPDGSRIRDFLSGAIFEDGK